MPALFAAFITPCKPSPAAARRTVNLALNRLGIVLLGFFLSAILAGPAAAVPAKQEAPPALVTVAAVTEQDVTPWAEYVAHVEAVQSVALQARVSGVLEQLRFQEGSAVNAGDLLYVIEPAPYQLKVAVNQARLAKAQALAKQSGQHLARLQSVRSGGISLGDIETAEAALQQAQAEQQEAQALLQLAEIDLGYTGITAPISGRIGATKVTVGNLLGPTSGELARIVQLDPIRVLFSLSENEVKVLQAVQRAAAAGNKTAGSMEPRLKLADGRLLENLGRIDFVDNRVDATTGTIAVRALFANPAGQLLPGQYVTLLLGQAQRKAQPVVPQLAVLEDRAGRYVLLVDEQRQVVQRRITTGTAMGSFWAVTSGLTAGEQVIVQGLQKVKPGQTVNTTTAGAAQGN